MVTREARRVAGPVGLFLLVLAVVLAPLAPVSAAPGDPGTITGVVRGPDSQPLAGATVTLYDDAQVPTGTTRLTGPTGAFEFTGLSGEYYVGAAKTGVGAVFYDGATSLADATPLFPDEVFGE